MMVTLGSLMLLDWILDRREKIRAWFTARGLVCKSCKYWRGETRTEPVVLYHNEIGEELEYSGSTWRRKCCRRCGAVMREHLRRSIVNKFI